MEKRGINGHAQKKGKTKMKTSFYLLGTILLGGLLVPTTAFADASGEATVNFTEDSNATTPKDPTDPSKENPNATFPDAEGNKETGAKGPLSLDVVPSTMNFGTQTLDYKGGTYNGIASTAAGASGLHFIQVTDNRGTIGGWRLTVKRTEFATSDSTKQISGSRLLIPKGIARNSLADVPSESDSNVAISTITTSGDPFIGMYEIGLESSTLLKVGAPTADNPVIGKGTTTYSWKVSDEKMSIPVGFGTVGAYSSTVNWTVTAGADS